MLKVACLPSHPLEKRVARKKRRGSEAVYEALLPPPPPVVVQMYKVDRSLADPLLPVRVAPEVNLGPQRKAPHLSLVRLSGSVRGDERQRKGSGGFMIGERGGGTTRRIHIRNRQHEHKRNLELRIETKRTTSILGAEVYEEWLFGPFRPVVRTSSFHVEDTGSIPVRDSLSRVRSEVKVLPGWCTRARRIPTPSLAREGGTSRKMVVRLCARRVLVLFPSIAWLGSLCKEGKASVQAMPSCLCSWPCLLSAEVRKVGSASLVDKDLVVAEDLALRLPLLARCASRRLPPILGCVIALSLVVGAILKEFRAKGWSFIPTPSSLSSVVRLESSLS
ncbi:hypothetical protein FNV43_RR08336 [Rhamnella rubrinervis]|uniref:Uncharacterized protein n=1 Tax=Rhamnella rubrinervis TaxID=2594499 RepID=A0A8K0HHL5_9ROSA|nr:hypothetical protein FNV43_RR08336 [Rhamnella rubrinervis]